MNTISLIAQDAIKAINKDSTNEHEALDIVGVAISLHLAGYTTRGQKLIIADFHRKLNHECRMLSGIPAHEADRAEIVNALASIERGGSFE